MVQKFKSKLVNLSFLNFEPPLKYIFNQNHYYLDNILKGANIATIISGKLRDSDPYTPNLQILINPPTQYFNFLLPSQIAYSYLEPLVSRPKLALWHMGMTSVQDSHESILYQNLHTLLLDRTTREKFASYVDVELVGDQYKQGRYYYTASDSNTMSLVYPESLKKTVRLTKNER